MNAFTRFFHIILWQPLFNLLVVFYLLTGNLGIAIIILTLLVRIVLYPMQNKASKSQMAMQSLQSQVKEIQNKYKDNKEEQTKQILALYKEKEINPFSGFLTLFIQIPVFIVLYNIFRSGITEKTLQFLYSFVPAPEQVNTIFLGMDLSEPNKLLAVIVAILFFLQVKLSAPKQDKSKKKGMGDMIQKQMNYFFPVLIGFAIAISPAALGLYLAIGTLFLIIQQHFVKKRMQENV